ncbi:transcription repressor OFP1-like [Salvia hispanica]|uniref:transcription repressor OFP1-like n=1 Tax=Salvia hispanica TaxID=49212 RepID=UPI0020090AD6|nr:transcription repressor OFP1-like [Salvia hispanica]XP_047952239.1 transcription repressor OFP1-like [Salvia hispanica]
MGNYKFRFSNMIPNAWFHKLKNMNNNTKTLNLSKHKDSSLHSPEFTNSNQRKSYYFTRGLALVQPSRPTQPRQFSTSVPTADNSSECTNSRSSLSEPDSILTEYSSDSDRGTAGAAVQSCIAEDPGKCGPGKSDVQCRRLPPIITRKAAPSASPVRRQPSGIKLRVNSSPRLAVHGRRRSMVVLKASKDPRRDFRESMVEMISQYNIRESNDLEELLACYLLLNSDDHHHLIINVFKQIWFDFIHLRLQ